MFIILLGATPLGIELATNLCAEGHDLCIISENSTQLEHTQQFIDCQTIIGCPSHPHILREANAELADMIIAATQNDEMNMVACQVAYSLFKVKRKIAFISNAHYLLRDELFNNLNIPIDTLVSVDDIIAKQLLEIITFSAGYLYSNFENSNIKLALTTIKNEAFIKKQDDKHVLAVFRDQKMVHNGPLMLEDEIIFLSDNNSLSKDITEIYGPISTNKRIMISGNPGIIESLEPYHEDFNIKAIEPNIANCERLSQKHPNVTILHGHITENELLASENMAKTDIFCALTNDDEDNIMSSLQAKELGAKKVIAMVSKNHYKKMLSNSTIDFILDPKQNILDKVLHHIRHPWIQNIHKIPKTDYQILELKNTKKIRITELHDLNVLACIHNNEVLHNSQEIPAFSVIILLTNAHDDLIEISKKIPI